jgi:hypothetical protein
LSPEQSSVFDPEDIPLSTSEGRRPSSTAGDRMMVGLAVAALLGGVLIAVSRLVPEQPDQTSLATATPRPTLTEGTPKPEPTLRPREPRTTTVDPAAAPSEAEPVYWISDWVRVRTRLAVHATPHAHGHTDGVLRRGDAAHISDPPDSEAPAGWLQAEFPMSGWIRGDLDDEAMFERFSYRPMPNSGVNDLKATANGFTAQAYTTDQDGGLDLRSSDGVTWERTTVYPNSWGRVVALGPAGWLRLANVDLPDRSAVVVWQSSDAMDWQLLGALSLQVDSVVSLAASDAGYVMTTSTGGGTSGVWYSADGQLWTERPVRITSSGYGNRVIATSLGFVVWGDVEPAQESEIAISADGWTWTDAGSLGQSGVIDVLADGDHLLALGRARNGARMWKGTIGGQQVTWSAESVASFGDVVLSRMVSDGERVIVLGWERATDVPLWWDFDGTSWRRHTMPADFNGLPHEAAGGPAGIVAVAQVSSGDGDPPQFWRLVDGFQWEPESEPVMPRPAKLTSETCGTLSDDVLAMMNMDGLLAAECFGDSPITIRAWSQPCSGCYGEGGGHWQPAWLAQPADDRVIHLSPIESGDWGTFDGVLHPSISQRSPRLLSTWVQATGHFDDPASASCRWTPTTADEAWYTGTDDVVAGCRARFVITSIHRIDGP